MTYSKTQVLALALLAACIAPRMALAEEACDGPSTCWTHRLSRNMASPARNLPEKLTDENKLWEVGIGGYHYAAPVIAEGRVIGGTVLKGLDERAFYKRATHRIGSGRVYCLDIQTGKLLWEMPTHGVTDEKLNMWWYGSYGVCSRPLVDGEKVYILGSAGDLLCVDVKGQADGNDGPFMDEATYFAGGGATLPELKESWGDILWRVDLAEQYRIQLHDAVAGSMLLDGDYLYIPTGQSVGTKGLHRGQHPAFRAGPAGNVILKDSEATEDRPNLLVLNKNTGQVVARDDLDVPYVWHGQWSSPSMGVVDGRKLVFFGDGYGVLHAIEAYDPAKSDSDRIVRLETAWSLDCVPERYRYDEKGQMRKYTPKHDKKDKDAVHLAPSDIIGAPVFHAGRVYVSLGRDLNHGNCYGKLWCVEAKTGKPIWSDEGFGTTMTTMAAADGLLIATTARGVMTCYDALTGESLWNHDFEQRVYFGSPLVADGKIYVANDRGELAVMALAREKRILSESRISGQFRTPTAMDGLIIIPTSRGVTAWAGPGYEKP